MTVGEWQPERGLAGEGQHAGLEGRVRLHANEAESQEEMAGKGR